MERRKPEVRVARAAEAGSPSEGLLAHVERRLEEQAPDALACIIMATPDGYEVHLTRAHAALAPLVDAAVDEFQRTVPATTSLPDVRVVADAEHSQRLLSALRDQVLTRSEELKARGIMLMRFGVNVWINRLDIGVKDLTDERKQFLEREFGADKVHVFEEKRGWYGYGPLPSA